MREKFLGEAQYSRGKYWKNVFKEENPNHFILFFNALNIMQHRKVQIIINKNKDKKKNRLFLHNYIYNR